jgi:hypothetical protein
MGPTMASNEEIIRNLYVVAEKEPKKFRSLFTETGRVLLLRSHPARPNRCAGNPASFVEVVTAQPCKRESFDLPVQCCTM